MKQITEIAEEAMDPRYYMGQEDKLADALQYLNQHLEPDGFVLTQVGQKHELRSGEDVPEYQVALSCAGEDRSYVHAVAQFLKRNGVDVFYDEFEEAKLWGKDLYEYLDEVFRTASRYCVMFISEDYARKVWPTHERRSAFARALEEKGEYILPARFDDTEIPGLRATIGYVDLREKTPEELAKLLLEKLQRQ